MPPDFSAYVSRRNFLRSTGHAALVGAALPMGLNLAALGEAAAITDPGDYKALVCVFLYGANDYANTVVTYDQASYDKYAAIRLPAASGGIALARSDLAATRLVPKAPATAPVDPQGVVREFALHPQMTAMAGLFNAGNAAIQLNVGPLIKPLTRAQYDSKNRTLYPCPPQLFSHNDQQSIWQSSAPEGAKVGWGGKLGDDVVYDTQAGTPITTVNSSAGALFTCMSVTGNAVFLSGSKTLQYQISSTGAIKIKPATDNTLFGSQDVRNALASIIQDPTTAHSFGKEYNAITKRSMDAELTVRTAAGQPMPNPSTPFPNTNLGKQLKMVAQLINGRATLGVRRQVFMVSIGGFDLHDNLISAHPALLDQVDKAIAAFYSATKDMGLDDKVTTFTASDFGRTLTSNGDGSDHGWGSHHFIVGGAVKGGAFYGTPPPVSVTNTSAPEDQWHVGQGRLLPTTSVDQYAATMAKWFGVDDSKLHQVVANINNFGGTTGYPRDMGFMKAP
ncbi:DUF1501 domain-containing protein [Rhodoferax aquaticus]|uniref:DUF1501 domain-containing protein n=1 Tax=Rhodoferax aquaticus TaxID=2527691 RepID=A0A515EJR5_9BURK|nr:DUF1501 domain-containing protein [Rhodoferax aquaticus]QDL52908.1 DUF1501 domain-containing protein [Rhodoferax aquaticus]